jgi:hypothetical protein
MLRLDTIGDLPSREGWVSAPMVPPQHLRVAVRHNCQGGMLAARLDDDVAPCFGSIE